MMEIISVSKLKVFSNTRDDSKYGKVVIHNKKLAKYIGKKVGVIILKEAEESSLLKQSVETGEKHG